MKTLSPNQAKVKAAVDASPCSIVDIAQKSGVCVTTISLWINGHREPQWQSSVDAVLEAIELLNKEAPLPWHIALPQLKQSGKTIAEISKVTGKSRSTVVKHLNMLRAA